MRAGWTAASLVVVAALLGAHAAPVGAEDETRLYITINRSRVLELQDQVTKVAVTNPSIADVTVVSPHRLVVNAKGVGQTSLLLFRGPQIDHYDVVVLTAAMSETAQLKTDSGQHHSVLVQRADKFTSQVFVRGADSGWVELGTVKPATEAGK